jgi:hypothetical protein
MSSISDRGPSLSTKEGGFLGLGVGRFLGLGLGVGGFLGLGLGVGGFLGLGVGGFLVLV